MKKILAAAVLLLAFPVAMAQSPEQKSPSSPEAGTSPSPLGEGAATKAPAKKPAAKKPAPARKPAPPKKPAPPRKPAAPKPPAPPAAPAGPPNVTVYKSGQKMPPTLRDKDGNLIPTSPDAYDVSSATAKKK